ncbi:putative transcription factor bHLH family [Dioscorea sansibarensis]
MNSSSSSSAGGAEASGESISGKKPRPSSTHQAQSKWRTSAQERIYNRRLIEALRAVRGARAVKDAADSALAITARGQSRWSRAILAGRLRRRKLLVKAGGKIRRHRRPKPPVKPAEPASMKVGKVGERLRVLGRLVPGCRKLSAPSLLEETADYVAALELQVKAMRALADALSAATVTTAAAPDG